MADKKFSISFYGAAREVTGSCFLLETDSRKILIDCGMFQGHREAEAKNHTPFLFNPVSIEAVIITHAHLDHIGRVPKLVKDGFRGKIFSTASTRDLAEIMWKDAAHLEADEEMPLYNDHDIGIAMGLFQTLSYYEPVYIDKDLSFQLLSAGHILGSAMVRFQIGERVLTVSGDVGNEPSLLMPPRSSATDTNILLVESTYGNKTHQHVDDRTLLLERAIEDTVTRKGALIIPVFATERTQEILYAINEMFVRKRVPDVRVFVDSPLAIRSTKIFERYPDSYRPEIQELFKKHPRLFQFKLLKFTETVEESKAINDLPPPKVILAGSGMMSGGRILHHARRYLSDPNSIILFVGYQASGSIGRRIIDGAKEVKIRGELISVKAEHRMVDGFSAHADEEQLFSFVEEARDSLKKVFVIHGELDAALNMTNIIQDRLGIPAEAPEYGEKVEL
ncbi:MAG: MBL fold metallo-hydrolase [bacterium]|nr:MBL fold metallo-hydrolase [bacterium]